MRHVLGALTLLVVLAPFEAARSSTPPSATPVAIIADDPEGARWAVLRSLSPSVGRTARV